MMYTDVKELTSETPELVWCRQEEREKKRVRERKKGNEIRFIECWETVHKTHILDRKRAEKTTQRMEAYNIQYGHVSDVIRLEKNLSFKGNKHFLKPTEGLAVKYLFAEIWEHDQTGCREPIILYTSRTECKHK